MAVYSILIRGELTPDLLGLFDDAQVDVEEGQTSLRFDVPDQARLHGMLTRLRDLALEIIEVRCDGDVGQDRRAVR